MYGVSQSSIQPDLSYSESVIKHSHAGLWVYFFLSLFIYIFCIKRQCRMRWFHVKDQLLTERLTSISDRPRPWSDANKVILLVWKQLCLSNQRSIIIIIFHVVSAASGGDAIRQGRQAETLLGGHLASEQPSWEEDKSGHRLRSQTCFNRLQMCILYGCNSGEQGCT